MSTDATVERKIPMCGITGWIDWQVNKLNHKAILEKMTETLTPRGPDAQGVWLSPSCALGHRRLAVMDVENGAQPMIRYKDDKPFIIVYNGELYNAAELREALMYKGWKFSTTCDTEVLLIAYLHYGRQCVDLFNGIFAFAIWDEERQHLFAARDRLGVKPFFYSYKDNRFIFASELKALLEHPAVEPQLSEEGLAEVFIQAPARTPGHGVFDDINELKPGYCLELTEKELKIKPYWTLKSYKHEHSFDETVEHIRSLLLDTVKRQMISDVPLGTLLSGGLDSSALSALAVKYGRANAPGLRTFSVDYVDNDKYFQAHHFQPNQDRPYIEMMRDTLKTEHIYETLTTEQLVLALKDAMLARDLPGMADIDASLLLFSHSIKQHVTVAISGEGADEIFGGYPWFHQQPSQLTQFPWATATSFRKSFLSTDLVESIKPDDYVRQRFEEAKAEVPALKGDNELNAYIRQLTYYNITRFMPTLLDRKDRMTMAAGLEVRVPFCDHRLVEYVFNIPWEMKIQGDREKGILRKALHGILPDEVLYRKKSPYPKTHNPHYLKAVTGLVEELLADSKAPLLPFIKADTIRSFMNSSQANSLQPWFGQLMSGPQLFAYLYQMNEWLKHYKVKIK